MEKTNLRKVIIFDLSNSYVLEVSQSNTQHKCKIINIVNAIAVGDLVFWGCKIFILLKSNKICPNLNHFCPNFAQKCPRGCNGTGQCFYKVWKN